jgi:hypothetical protein
MEGYGNRLASGARSAIFGPNNGAKISDEQWRAAFEGFDPEDFKKNGFKAEDDPDTSKRTKK